MKKTPNKERPGKDFLAEAEDILDRLGKGLISLEKSYKTGSVTPTLVNGIFRTTHTLKGVCGVYGYNDMVSLSNSMEDAFDSLRIGRVLLTDELLGALMRSYALLLKMTASSSDVDFKGETNELMSFLKKTEVTRPGRRKEDHVERKLLDMLTDYEENKLFESIRTGLTIFLVETVLSLDTFDSDYESFANLLEPEADVIATLPSKNKSASGFINIELLVGSLNAKEGLEERLGARCKVIYSEEMRKKITISGQGAGSPVSERLLLAHMDASLDDETLKSGANSVRVDISKLDRVMGIVGELGLLRSDLTRLAGELKKEMPYSSLGFEFMRLEKHLDRKFTELRGSILDVRLVQIGQLFSRYETMLSLLCRKMGKDIRMETFGDDTEIDKLMVEELADPIMHMIRNVVDHAIETPDERVALGKEKEGTITFRASQKGNRVIIEVSDDGRGIDAEVIAEKAVKKGLVTGEHVKNLSVTEKMDLIFLPGFTTSNKVSDVSGRGVGLDVVKENIAKLSGSIEIETAVGQGTKFSLTIPITLAITQALIVEDAGDRYALPLSTVSEVVTIDPRDIFLQDGYEVIKVMDRTVPLARLSSVMGTRSLSSNGGILHGVLAGIAEHRLCITAEKIVEQLDVVIKPISSTMKLPGIAGATDLGMGEKGTILVLDVRDILESILREKTRVQAADEEAGEGRLEGAH